MKTISRIDPVSLGKVYGAILGVFGIVAGLLVAIGGTAAMMGGAFGGLALGALSIVVFPLLYALLGFVSGWATAIVYNFVATKVGGIKVELK